MKTTISAIRRKATVLATAFVLIAGAASAKSLPVAHAAVSPVDEQVSVQYIGTNETNFVFRVNFENTAGSRFWLIIRNDAGDVVYEQAFKDAHFAKSVFIPKGDSDIHPTFVIRTENAQVERKFSVNRVVNVLEDVQVTKI